MSMNYMPERLRKLINKTGVGVKRLHKSIGVGESTLAKMSWDHNYEPGLKTITALSEYFQVPMEYFFEEFSEEDAMNVYTNYAEIFQNMRKDAYESYILAGRIRLKPLRNDGKIESPWPYNLAEDIMGEPVDYIIEDEDWSAFEESIKRFPAVWKRYEGCVVRYYRDGMTLDAIGEEYGVVGSRVQQIIKKFVRIAAGKRHRQYITGEYVQKQAALDILRRDVSILESKKANLETAIQELEDKQIEALKEVKDENNMPVMDILLHDVADELSSRAYNCLIRRGGHAMTIGDVVDIARKGELAGIRNLGKISRQEVLHFIKRMTGIELEESA